MTFSTTYLVRVFNRQKYFLHGFKNPFLKATNVSELASMLIIPFNNLFMCASTCVSEDGSRWDSKASMVVGEPLDALTAETCPKCCSPSALAIHCTGYILYCLYTALAVNCTDYILHRLYTALALFCTCYILHWLYSAIAIYFKGDCCG